MKPNEPEIDPKFISEARGLIRRAMGEEWLHDPETLLAIARIAVALQNGCTVVVKEDGTCVIHEKR